MNPPDTEVIRTLDANGIGYRLLPHDEPVFTVEAAAEQRGVIKEEMVKSILLRDRKGKHVMACVTGDARLNPHAVRAYLGEGWGRFSFATADQIEELLGFVQGAVAPVGLPADIPVVFDQGIADCKKVNISSGDPMAGLELATEDLIRVAEAQLAQIAADT
jgi:prolyl-tRNA editing enzyme YbaK/EbsC (Cys-tRNA(Pro) deacylase)